MRIVLAILISLFVIGCAKSPQQVMFVPELAETKTLEGSGQTIQLMFKDTRENQVIGSRGGVYKDTSTISLDKNAITMMNQYMRENLASLNFGFGDMGDSVWTLTLNTLTYELKEISSLKNEVIVNCMVSLEVVKNNSTYTKNYSARSGAEVVSIPTGEKNAEVINRALNLTLSAVFRDANLNQFIQ